jgi:phosphate transport system substrate-binding protein
MAAVAVTLVAGIAALYGALLGSAAMVGAGQPQLTSTGSSFAGVAITQWEGQFNELDGGNINFTVSSSVLGMNQFCDQTVAFGATDIAYSTNQSQCTTSQVPYPFQYMPDVAGGLAFEYNVDGQNGSQINNLILNSAAITGIFTGSITNWDNPMIQSLNPAIRLPNEQITAFYRSDASGENYLLSDYMLHTDPGPITAFQQLATIPTPPGQPSATWASFSNGVPAGLSGLVAVSGADAASQGPLHAEGAISYVETAYAKNVGLPVASVVNAAGNPEQPTAYNVATALTAAILYSDLTQNLGGVYTNTDADTYPISAYSYFVAQCVPSQAAAQSFSCDSQGNVTMGTSDGAEFAQFIEYVACLGQKSMAQLGYSPLPPNLVEDDFQAAGRLPGGTTPPAPTAANCQNPYITGALQAVGGPTVVASSNPGGSDVGTNSTSAAAAAAAVGSKGAAAASTGRATTPGGTAATASAGTSAATGAAGSTVAGSTAASPGGSATVHHTVNPLTGPSAYPRQEALTKAATVALTGLSLTDVAFWCAVFIMVLGGIPLGVWVWNRRREYGGPAS